LVQHRARLEVSASIDPLRLEHSRQAHALAQHNQVGSALAREPGCNIRSVS
jgi:hypothetical protein